MPPSPLRVLVVEDNPGDAFLVEDALARCGLPVRIRIVDTLQAAVALAGEVDVVLLDLHLPDSQGQETLDALSTGFAGLPVVVVSGIDDGLMAMQALHVGAQDYLVKGRFDEPGIGRTLRYAMERFALQRELRRQAVTLEANLHAVVDHSGDGLLILDDAQVVRFANRAAHEQLDVTVGQPVEVPLRLGVGDVATRDGGVAEVLVTQTVWGGRAASLATMRTVTAKRKVESALRQAAAELEGANDVLSRIATHDPLTGVLNRVGFERVLRREAARAEISGTRLACFLLDCDDFKNVNDRFGHEAGDRVLAGVARALWGSVRPTDHVGRVGGDEFVGLLPDADLAEAVAVAERVRAAVCAEAVPGRSGAMELGCSIGVALLPTGANTVGDVLLATDGALAISKGQGKNRVSTVSLLPHAFDAPQALPILCLADGGVVGDLVRLGANLEALADPRGPGRIVLLVELSALGRARLDTLSVAPGVTVVAMGRAQGGVAMAARARLHAVGARFGVGGAQDLEALAQLAPDLVLVDAKCTLGVAGDAERLSALRRLVAAILAVGAEPLVLGFSEADREALVAVGVTHGVA